MPHRRSMRFLTPLIALLAAVLATGLLAACGGGDDSGAKAGDTPQQAMRKAKKLFDDASSVGIDLTTKSTPSGGNGVLGARGSLTHDPAYEGDVKVVLNGLTATVPITSVDGKVYAKLPLQTSYSVIDPEEYGAPDPADFADPDTGISSLLTQIDDLKKQGELRSGKTILTTYSGTLPGTAVKTIIPSAAAEQTYKTKVGVDEKGYARTVRITGTFFSGSDDVTYDVKLSDYDAGVKISAPAS